MSDASPGRDVREFPRLGNYKILRQLGSGGMSNVFQAIHEDSGSIVALKVLPRKLAQNPVLLQRFLREARSAENLDHPNIVAIYDLGYDQGRHYLVLEFVDGRDLSDRVRTQGTMGPVAAVTFIRQVAQGLDYAARQGMIHRDIKPANLLLTPDGQAKIIDLGLAFQAEEEDERVTRDGTTVGTVDYMSPEQARDSRKVGEQSDIYSLGCTLYYLLTGSPPFPGGTLADKLARHHSAPVPDVRERKPDVPADLAALVRRMMAKKPGDRYAGYQALIEALDRIDAAPESAAGSARPDVLIDEDDDSDDAIELTVAEPSDAAPAPAPAKLGARRPAPPDRQAPPAASAPAISLADLAALDAEAPPLPGRGGARRPPDSSRSSALVDALLEDDAEPVAPGAVPRRGDGELPLQTWIAAGASVGLLIAVLAFGVRFVFSLLDPAPAETAPSLADANPDGPGNPAPAPPPPEGRSTRGPAAPRVPRPSNPTAPPRSELVGPPAPPSFHVEPAPRPTTEVAFAPEVVARLGFPRPAPAEGVAAAGVAVVRRLVDPAGGGAIASLAAAFDRPGDDVEIADTGPFHEDDFQLAGKSRVVRARPGFRPMVVIQSSRQALVREQEAKFMLGLGGVERLLIEGIDLVVDVRDLPRSQAALFLCQGVELTLRDCTITVVNAADRPGGFSVFRLAAGPRRNLLRLDRTLIRGPIPTLAVVAAGRADILLERAVVLGAGGPLIQLDATDPAERSVRLYRSVLAAQGPVVGWTRQPTPTVVRALGCTFARVESRAPAALLAARSSPPADPASWLDYDGEANRWYGWSSLGLSSAATDAPSGVRSALRAIAKSADELSRDAGPAWPADVLAEGSTAARVVPLIPGEEATLAQVAAPHPLLLEQTVALFPRQPAPELPDQLASWPAPSRPVVSLPFDAQAGGPADLGAFLKERVVDPGKHYVVQVQGVGTYPMSPVRLPDGSSLAIVGAGGGGSAPVAVLVASRSAPALIELHGGDLALENLGFATDGQVRPEHWILVEDGRLGLRRCRYRDLGPAEAPGGAAIALVARSPEPLPPRAGPFRSPTDRLTAKIKDSWIWTSADAVSLELARGAVEFENCLVNAGPVAFRLVPGAVASGRFEADLILENCTVSDDRFGVALEPAGGSPLRFIRPWLVVSRSCVFPRIWRDNGALLGVDPPTFEAGGLFWQSSNDLYETNRFIGPTAAATAPGASADLKRQWVDLWGIIHTRNDRGPDPRKPERIVHFRDKDRPRTARPAAAQLELDPKIHAGQGVDFAPLPPIPKS